MNSNYHKRNLTEWTKHGNVFSHSSGVWNPKIRMSAWSVSPEGPFLVYKIMTSSEPNYLSKGTSPNIITLQFWATTSVHTVGCAVSRPG